MRIGPDTDEAKSNNVLKMYHLVINLPSVLIFSEVLTTANSVALKRTVPSELSGMFIETRRLHATR